VLPSNEPRSGPAGGTTTVAQIVKLAAATATSPATTPATPPELGSSRALAAGSTREQVQRHGRWSNIRSIDPYYRKTEIWGRNNPSQRLAG